MADALGLAFGYLNRRERTVAEVRTRLEGADFSGEEVDAALAELQELGYLDDARFARLYTEDKRNLEQWGRERIARGLSEKGIAQPLINAALDGDGEDELSRAVELLQQRFPQPARERKERERAFGVLARKGYDADTAGAAVRRWADAAG